MKHNKLIKTLSGLGCILVRRGGKHDLFKNPVTGKQQPIPRHTEIDEYLAKHIIKELS